MDFVSEEFVTIRMAEPLEEKLRAEGVYFEQQRELVNTWDSVRRESKMAQELKELYGDLEEKYTTHIYLYGKGAYCLGIEDGVQMGTEQRLNSEVSVLSLTDMTHLIYVYDAVKQLNKTVVGAFCLHAEKGGVLSVLDRVYDVIENGVSAKIRLRGEDEAFDYIIRILDDPNLSPEERAIRLIKLE